MYNSYPRRRARRGYKRGYGRSRHKRLLSAGDLMLWVLLALALYQMGLFR